MIASLHEVKIRNNSTIKVKEEAREKCLIVLKPLNIMWTEICDETLVAE